MSIAEAAEQAINLSQITLPGSTPFHLKAQIADAHDPTKCKAEVEEYWASPEKWRRTIHSADFSQTLIVSGDKLSEQDAGDYYPFWLRDLVTAMFDPLPMRQQLMRVKGEFTLPMDSEQSQSCVNMAVPGGYGPVKTNLPFVFCFMGKTALLQDVITPGYRAHFHDYAPFNSKRLARLVRFSPDAATSIEARVTEVTEFKSPDEALFTVDQSTPAAAQLKSSQIGEDTARRIMLGSPEISWPAVREGKTSGVISVYISVDRSGRVREVWPLASDNSELTTAARDQVQQWKFQPYVNGVPMQMESVLTLPFNAKQGPPIPVLSNAEARKLAIRAVEAQVAPGAAAKGTRFSLRVAVDEQGKITDIRNVAQVKPALWKAGERALQQWKFRPYVHEGAADRFYADIAFVVK